MDPLIPAIDDYLGRTDFTLRLAPIRRALVIDDGDLAQLISALQAAVTLWGGGRCPVVRVREDGPASPGDLQIAEVLGVDHAIDFRTSGDIPANLGMAIFSLDMYEKMDEWRPHAAVVAPERTVLEIFTTEAGSLISCAGAGAYGDRDQIHHFRSAGYNVVDSADDVHLALAQIDERTAWAATLVGDVDTDVRDAIGESVGFLMVAEETDFASAVNFWNYRALRPRGASGAEPVTVLATPETARDSRFQAAFKDAVERTSRCTPSFILVCEADLRDDLIAELGASYDQSGEFSERWGTEQAASPLSFGYRIDPRPLWLSPRSRGRSTSEPVTLRRPASPVRWQSPVTWRPAYAMAGKVHALVRSTSINGPRRDAVAGLFVPNATWWGDDIALRTLNLPQYTFNIGLPTPQEVLVATMLSAGLTYALSDKGQQIAGLARAHSNVGIFRSRSTFEVVQALTGKPGRDVARELKELRESGEVSDAKLDELQATFVAGSRPAKTLSDIKGAVSNELRSGVQGALEELLSSGSVELGVKMRCELCLLREFRPLSSASGPPICAGCGSRARISSTGAGDPQVHYRLTGLLHTASQNGGMVPLAAQVFLEAEGAYVVPGANLARAGEASGEVDLLGWAGSKSFAGEVKTSAGGFAAMDGPAEIAKLAATGVDQVILVCGEPVEPGLTDALQVYAEDVGIALRVVDGPTLWV